MRLLLYILCLFFLPIPASWPLALDVAELLHQVQNETFDLEAGLSEEAENYQNEGSHSIVIVLFFSLFSCHCSIVFLSHGLLARFGRPRPDDSSFD